MRYSKCASAPQQDDWIEQEQGHVGAAQGPMFFRAFLVSSFSRSASRVVLACHIEEKAGAISEGRNEIRISHDLVGLKH